MAVFSKLRRGWGLLRETFSQYTNHDPFRNSVVVAYYTILSLPGLLAIIIALAGAVMGEEAVQRDIAAGVAEMLNETSAQEVENMAERAAVPDTTTVSSVLSILSLIFGATGAFYQLQQVINSMWEVKVVPQKMLLKFVKDRLFSFGLILTIGFLLLVSLAISAALGIVSDWVAQNISESLLVVMRIINIAVSFAIAGVLFSAMFKFLPDAEVRWADVWVGGFFTSFLFVIAKYGLSFYFSISNPASSYGAAGGIILIMLWTTYAGLIVLFGAQFTKVYAGRHGENIEPSDIAVSTAGEPQPSKFSTTDD